MWICIVPYLEGNPIFIYDSNEKREFQENLCQFFLFRCAMSSIILNIYLNICCAGLMDMNIIKVFFGCFFKTSINRFKYLSFVVWFACTLAVYHYEHLICIQIGIVYKINIYFFCGLQYVVRSDIKEAKNTPWQKVLAMVLFLVFVVAFVATLTLLLQNDGLYEAFICTYYEELNIYLLIANYET